MRAQVQGQDTKHECIGFQYTRIVYYTEAMPQV